MLFYIFSDTVQLQSVVQIFVCLLIILPLVLCHSGWWYHRFSF